MKTKDLDYTELTLMAKSLGMVPHTNRMGQIVKGKYTLEGYEAPVDLSACAKDEKSILLTAIQQLSNSVNESYHNGIERDFID
jgi:hypothetical protein